MSEESPRLRRKKSADNEVVGKKSEERPTSPKLMPEKEEATVELMVEVERLRKESTAYGRLKKKHEDLERKVGAVQGTLAEVQEQQREERREAKALQDELLRRIESLGEALGDLAAENLELSKKLEAALVRTAPVLASKFGFGKKDLQQFNSIIEQMQVQLDAEQTQKKNLTEQLNTADNKLKQEKKSRTALEKDIKTLRRQARDFEEIERGYQESEQAYERRIEKLEGRMWDNLEKESRRRGEAETALKAAKKRIDQLEYLLAEYQDASKEEPPSSSSSETDVSLDN